MSPQEAIAQTPAVLDTTTSAKSLQGHTEKNGKSTPDSDSAAGVVVPPDGGWGWMVVFGSFMCNMVVDGILFSFGAFLRPIAIDLRASETQVALAGSLMSGFYLIVGPFASALANKYGFRLVAVGGSLLGCASLIASYFATDVQYLCITYGLLGGIGFGFIYVPAVITVGFYFEKWRALATGIGVCGSGIGTFLFAPLTDMLIRQFGWRVTVLCHAGIVLSCFLFGLIFRPLKPLKLPNVVKSESIDTHLVMDLNRQPAKTRKKVDQTIDSMTRSNASIFGVANNTEYPRMSDVYRTISIPSQIDSANQDRRLSVPSLPHNKTSDKIESREPLLDQKKDNQERSTVARMTASTMTQLSRPMYREDIFFSASLNRLPQYTSRTSLAYNLSVTRIPTKLDVQEEKERTCKLCPEAVKRTLATMLDMTLLSSPTFLLLAIGGFFTMMGFYVPFMFLSDRAKMYGIDAEPAVFLISAIGIANTLGRVLCGILGSVPGVDALFVNNAALTIGGLATILSGLSMTVEYQFVYTAIFGLAISCFASLRSIIVVDLLGLEKLTNAFGLLLLFQGVAATIGAPLAGAFKVATGSYDASFYLSGGLLVASAVMCYPLNYINRWELERNKNCKVTFV